jgi:predicted phosphoribosyltransferase
MSHLDDGIATRATTRAALRATRICNPKKLVLAVPVAPTSTLDDLRGEADDIVASKTTSFSILKQFSRRLNETKEPAA